MIFLLQPNKTLTPGTLWTPPCQLVTQLTSTMLDSEFGAAIWLNSYSTVRMSMPANTTNQSSLALMAGLLALWSHLPMLIPPRVSLLQTMVSVLIQATFAWWAIMVLWLMERLPTVHEFMFKTLPHQALQVKYLPLSQRMLLLLTPLTQN